MGIEALLGKTIVWITGNVGSEELTFYCADSSYRMYHSRDCCESVSVEDISGDLADLLQAPIVRAEEPSSLDRFDEEAEAGSCESFTWTFYILGTAKGTVTIRWLGTSNGYYSEGVSFEELTTHN